MQLSCVVAAGFGLNKTFRVPAQVWKQLPELQPRPDPEHHDDDPAPDPAPLSDEHGAATKPPSEDVELSDFEKRRLANIANNQAHSSLCLDSVLLQQVHLRLPPGPCANPGPAGPPPTARSSLAALLVSNKANRGP